MNVNFMLDASALLSVLLEEPGEARVREVLERSQMHSLNVAEAIGRLVRAGVPLADASDSVREFQFEVCEELRLEEAELIGALAGTRRHLGMALGDWVCLVSAARQGSVALTADRKWQALHGEVFRGLRFQVEVIR